MAELQPGSVAARAGLADGDRILRANGQTLVGFSDWQRAGLHLDPSRPLVLEIVRNGRQSTASLTLSHDFDWLRSISAPGLVAFRFAQIVTLAFALLVALRRSFNPVALLGALMLGSMATVSLVLPMRLAVFWHALPDWFGWLLWMPFTSSAAVGPLLFAFSAVFPRLVWSKASISVALIPGGAVAAWHLYSGVVLMGEPGPPTGLPNAIILVFVTNVIYAALALVLFLAHRTAATTLTDRRRTGVLILGTAVGAAAAIGVFAAYWRNPGAGIFATRWATVLSLLFLAMPASFAYAILRHRLFDVRLIVRQGLRYALARRFLDALIPVLGGLLCVDIFLHREQPIASLVQARWWWYVTLGAALVIVRSRREQWLKGLDRRFFRERYDAARLLTSIADQVARASSFEAVAPSIVQQIDEALHPTFVTVLTRLPGESAFSGGSGLIAGATPSRLPASLTVIGVLAFLRKPLALSLGVTAWVRHQLPLEERTLLIEHGIELLVPISAKSPGELPLALLVLGPRRSEEPYSDEDMHLLGNIADAVGVLLERSAEHRRGLAECERCGRCFDGTTDVCPEDGSTLVKLRGTLLLNERYHLQRRLGRGGMGTVYAAQDVILERAVAVKVIRDEFTGPLDLAARFRHEARAAAGFSHPHVVRVYDFGVDGGGRPFLVMELLDGSTLRERLVLGATLCASEVLHVMRGVCSAVDAAHARGLVHRDLKPENIFLQRHAAGVIPKVLDFGLVKALDHGQSTEATTVATSAGVLIGTLEYMAPEQVAGDEVSPAWDVWALAVIAYEMLTGTHPFRRPIVPEMSPVPLGEVGSFVAHTTKTVTPGALAFFREALSSDRTSRPRSAGELLDRFERALTSAT